MTEATERPEELAREEPELHFIVVKTTGIAAYNVRD